MWGFLKSKDGTTAIEYAIIASLIAVAIVAAVVGYSDTMGVVYNKIETAMQRI